MKNTIAFIIVLQIITYYIKCSVLTSNKNRDITHSQIQNEALMNSSEKSKVFEKPLESFEYLDGLLSALQNENWTDEEKPCLEQTTLLLKGLHNFTLWAVWDWDAISFQPQGLLYGSRYHLGNFDECLKAPWNNDHPELGTQYCLAEITLQRTNSTDKRNLSAPYDPYGSALNLIEHTSLFKRTMNQPIWGLCVPAVCQKDFVARLTGFILEHSHLGASGLKASIAVPDQCQKSEAKIHFDGLFYGFMGMMSVLLALALLCTYVNREGSDLKCQFTQAFDIRENAKNLLTVKKDGFELIYGIRFLTMFVVVICHQTVLFNSGPVSDGFIVDKEILSVSGMLLLHLDLTVDTFFFLSGMLTAVNIVKMKTKINPLILFLKRYVRLAVAYAVVIFYVSAVFPYTGSGPLWNKVVALETQRCRKNWWLSLLMLNNYIDTENLCVLVTWYIPCDFHSFVITVLMYWVYMRYPKAGKFLFVVVMIAAIITPGIINYIYKLPPSHVFANDFITTLEGSNQFHLTYIKSHTRYAAFLIGFFSGCLFMKYYKNSNKPISQKWAVTGSFVSIVIMSLVLLSGSTFIWRGYTMVESVVYAALNRPVWACSIALFILCCVFGYVPLVNGFLSWYPWAPLSRLSYGIYLVHYIMILRNVFIARNPVHNDHINNITTSFGLIVNGCIIALLLWLLVEAPINNIVTSAITSRMKLSKPSLNEKTPNTMTCTIDDNGCLNDNLPSIVHYNSSKM